MATTSQPVRAAPAAPPTDMKLASAPVANARPVLGNHFAMTPVQTGNRPAWERPFATRETISMKKLPPQSVNGDRWKAEPKLRDRLCQLIRQHQLDPVLVKSYAIDFCGTKTLGEASREQVEKFVVHFADWAAKDKNALICQLNSYVRPTEGAA